MKNPLLILLMLIIAFAKNTFAQNNADFAVQVSAVVQENPPEIILSWPDDPDAEQYIIYKRNSFNTSWGVPVVVLEGNVNSFSDTEVSIGESYEYSIYKSPCLIVDTVGIVPGTPVTFTIHDSWGDGICCRLGFGYYKVTSCDSTYATGGEFTFIESTSFTVPACTYPVTDVIISIYLDAIPEETTWVLKNTGSGATLASGGPYEIPEFGTICAGINVPVRERQGKVLLLVDDSYSTDLSDELKMLEYDLICDGWMVHRMDVDRNQSVQNVKSLILNTCMNDTSINVLFLFGHIPVPYSGNIAMDGHPDHFGAWPADLYYGDLDGEWTDYMVFSTSASRPENHNIPGDGKFDQSFIPSDIDLQVGRVDLINLPAFTENDVELLRRYLNKNHNFRQGLITAERRGLIDENLHGSYHAVGWRAFAPMFGAENIVESDYLPTLEQESYLWSFGCGGSSYTSCGGVASTTDFATKTIQTVFTMLFGSYFGDWDNQDNVLRSPLASDNSILVNFWSCIPSWYLHHMALGRNIGFSALLTQNMDTEYTAFYGNRIIHTALMGDPTLRMHVADPVPFLDAETISNAGNLLKWIAPVKNPAGYHIYRSNSITNPFQRINTSAVTDTFFIDPFPLTDNNVYMVRSIKLETTGSGTYYNLSQGIIDSISSNLAGPFTDHSTDRSFVTCYPNPATGLVNIQINGDSDQDIFAEIINPQGITIFRKRYTLTADPQVIRLNISHYSAGIYFVRILSGNKVAYAKFVIRKQAAENE